MDLVAACRAFVSVSERGSFTVGAAAARMAQSVASRRVAALERHLGGRLLDRSPRAATLTPFGRDVLPSARRLVELADRLEREARAAGRRPLRLAVPADSSTGALARLIAEAHRRGMPLDPHPAAPGERADLVASGEVHAALLAVPPADAAWTVPLGLAQADDPGEGPFWLDTLRPARADGDRRPRHVRVQPEDDVPHVRDRLARLGDAVGLRPAQVGVARTAAAAVADVLGRGDALLCSAAEAVDLGLVWRPLGELPDLARGFALAAAEGAGGETERFRTACARGIARCLGAGAAG